MSIGGSTEAGYIRLPWDSWRREGRGRDSGRADAKHEISARRTPLEMQYDGHGHLQRELI